MTFNFIIIIIILVLRFESNDRKVPMEKYLTIVEVKLEIGE